MSIYKVQVISKCPDCKKHTFFLLDRSDYRPEYHDEMRCQECEESKQDDYMRAKGYNEAFGPQS